MTLFPFFENIEGKTFLLVGGGSVAQRKLRMLKQFTDRIAVVAEQTDIQEARVYRRRFAPEDIALGDYIIAATGDRALNRRISTLARAAGKPVNVADDAALCTFFFPGIIKRGALVVAVSTGGSSPEYAKLLKQEICASLPENIEEIMEEMAMLRRRLPTLVRTQEERERICREALAALLAGETNAIEKALKQPEKVSRGTGE